ncbi:hypothetical protein QNK06_11020 [Bacillus subtilis]|uniref:hypothetical protein n=1 Tax=Bacillus subtilis TaxID=1423 RepID=UPI0024C11DE1|nr:hypothetical protein [Bacillus subtilis]WHY07533.1 hypothetical protein QNK06_11020 [Bacillus subtilis]WPP23708.1 hypothetical protein SIS06_11365 [Bacillus subtilis]
MCPDQKSEDTKIGSLGDFDFRKTESGASITRSSDRSTSIDFEKNDRSDGRSSYTAGISKRF